ncbi:hemolysin III family protein [soil metagenome]
MPSLYGGDVPLSPDPAPAPRLADGMPDAVPDAVAEALVKPRLRGVLHQIAFFVSLLTGGLLIAAADQPGERIPVVIYSIAISGLFGVSALFHRITWRPAARRWMRRADHSMIFFAIAGTNTAIAGLALEGGARTAVLSLVWAGAGVGVVMKLLWLDAPKWVIALSYVVLGWVSVGFVPQFYDGLGAGGFTLMAAGGLLYTVGAVVYARRRPDPVPAVFGYHEVFHALVIAAAICHYSVVAFSALS